MTRAELALDLTQDAIDQARKEVRAALVSLHDDVERMIDYFDDDQEGSLTAYYLSDRAGAVERLALRLSAARGQASLLRMVLDEQQPPAGRAMPPGSA